MVFLGAAVIFLALFPFALFHAGLRDGSLWGWASAIGGAGVLLAAMRARRVSEEMSYVEMWREPEINNLLLAVVLLGGFGVPVLLWFNAIGIVFDRSFAPYLSAVLLDFFVTLVLFVRLLQAAVGDRKRGG
jgi:hypothetical protein